MSAELRIFLFVMGVIVSLELACGVLIVMRAFLVWAFGPMQTRIVNTEVVRMHRPATLSEPMGSEPVSSEPVRAEPVKSEPVRSSGPNVSIRVEVSGEVAVQIDVGSDKQPCVEPQADVRDVAPDDTWSDF